MKKNILSLVLAVCLIICVLPAQQARAASDVCFISVNDRLLELSSQAAGINGVWYVPSTVFGDFGIYSSYFSSSTTVLLFTSEKQYYFDLKNGVTYDKDDKYYSAPGQLRGGVAYVPANFICQQFGLSWSYIAGNGYGDICRLKDSAVVLPDAQFLSAASDMMRSRYTAYKNASNPESPAPVKPNAAGAAVYLSFQGLPTDSILTALKAQGTQCTFFLSYDDIKSDPDRVRRIVGEGYGVGIICRDFLDYDAASGLLYEAAHIKTLLVAAGKDDAAACKKMADDNGLAFCGYNADGVRGGEGLTAVAYVTNRIGSYTGACYARLLCNDATAGNLSYLLRYFANNKCTVRPVNEVNHG